MKDRLIEVGRRKFMQKSAALTTGLAAAPLLNFAASMPANSPDSMYLIGPQEGYSPHIGTLLSMMTMMRTWVIHTVKDLDQEQLDFLIDDQSNSIGALLLHLAATEKYYQLNTFDEMEWGTWSNKVKKEWDIPMELGEKGRKEIRGNNIDYYLSKLEEVRAITKKEFAKRDDRWLQKSEPFFGGKSTNNYCKWFHVCEHESNHNGQIKFFKKRLPA